MSDVMTFPATFEEFAEQYKIVDTKQVYTNGTELIPIFRVKQWLEHLNNETDREVTNVTNEGVDLNKYSLESYTIKELLSRIEDLNKTYNTVKEMAGEDNV